MGSVSATRRLPRRSTTRSFSVEGVLFVPVVLSLVLLGLLMVYSASYARAYEQTGDPNFFFNRQLLSVTIALALFAVCARVDYRRWMALDLPLLAFAAVLVAATLVPGVATGTRWIRLGVLNLQPTEVLKVALLIYLASSLTRRQERVGEFAQGVWPHLFVAGGMAALSIKQPDFGMALMFLSITYFMLFVGGARIKHLLMTLLSLAPPLAMLMVAAPYRRARLFSFLDPFSNASGSGYQVIQSLVSLGSGGLWGRGLGAGIEKLGYLPAAHTDFIFSVLGEEFGIWGSVLLVLGFVSLGVLGLRIAWQASDRFGTLLAAGITFTLCLQALLNLGVALGLLPVTGLTLPFVSYGGSSLLASLAMAGIVLSVSREGGGREQRARLRRR